MAIPTFSMTQLVKAGVHFGHHTRRWNPKMGKFIYGSRENVHILDLQKTVPMMYQALQAVSNTVAAGGKVLMVGTKRQAQEPIREAAERCGQYYVNHRWLGGMMTNWKTVSNSIDRLKELNELISEGKYEGFTKKEALNLEREREKLDKALGGIKDMNGLPQIVFIIDTNKESLAIKEANKLGIPVIAVCDSNSNPDGIDFPIPGNDDAIRAVKLYCDLVAGSVLDGIQAELSAAGVDLGASEKLLNESLSENDEIDEDELSLE